MALGTVSLTGDRAQGDDSKYDSHYTEYAALSNTVRYRYSAMTVRLRLKRWFESRYVGNPEDRVCRRVEAHIFVGAH